MLIRRLLGSKWRFSGVQRLRIYLSLLFLVVGFALVLLGFDLDSVDRWIDRQRGWLAAVGTGIFDVILFCIGVFAALGAASFFFPKAWGPKAGLGGALFCALIAAWMFRVLWLGGVR